MKVLFKHYTSYGKGDNECVNSQWVDEDTPETRKQVIEDYKYAEWNGNVDDFINGRTNEISYCCSDDWDSPTGGYFMVILKEEAFEEVEKEYQDNKNKLIKLFEEE